MTFVVAGAASDHYDVCEITRKHMRESECVIENFRGSGLQAGDMVMVQDAPACGLAQGFVPGWPNNGVMVSRAYENIDEKYAGGHWYRLEHENIGRGTYTFDPIEGDRGMVLRICWCGKIAQCDPGQPADFNVDAGFLTVVRFEERIGASCEVGKPCIVKMTLAPHNTPMDLSDRLIVKHGGVPNKALECIGDPILGLGPNGDGLSKRMTIVDGVGVFDFGNAAAMVSRYRLCWCQGSRRPCISPEEFVYFVGELQVREADYVWPACTSKKPIFTSWRSWQTFDDCCCNFFEAGAIGCMDEESETFARCSLWPR